MKKFILFFTLILMMFVSGCKKSESPEKKQEAKKINTTESQVIENDAFYDKMLTDTRPIAVMIDNDTAQSRPQRGLESAYMVYEITVEGGATRFMALFKEHTLEKVGPVRSSRHYFLDYALEHDAIYCHAGWSPQASRDISALGVNNINGILGGDGGNFWRDNTYDKSWHNLYSGVDKLFDYGVNKKGYRSTTEVKNNLYNTNDITPSDGTDATEISIPYANFYTVGYKYDSESKLYKRYVNGSEHMSQTGECLSAKNIIIYHLKNYNLNDGENKGRQNLENIGSGTGIYVTDGKKIDISWSKQSRSGKTLYTTADGTELVLNPGTTYIQIVPLNKEVKIN